MVEGRELEWEAAELLLDGVADGAVALFLEGEPGIGKSTVLDATVAAAAGRGFTVLRCRPGPSEVRLAHVGLMELLDGVAPDRIDALPLPQRRAMRIALRWDEPDERPTEQQTVAAALAGVLRGIASENPLLLAVDDVHWLDVSTAQALEYAMRRLNDHPAAVLAAARTLEGDRPRPMERSLDPSRVRRVVMGGLDWTVIHPLLRERLQSDIPTAVADRIVHDSRGNPLVALEIGRAVLASGIPRSHDRLPVPDDLRAMLALRVQGLPTATRAALLEVAARGERAPAPTASAVEPAIEAGIVGLDEDGRVGFLHPLYESAVYSDATPGQRRAAHARIALASDDPEERARHLARSVDGPDPNVADELDRAVGLAVARGSMSAAFELATLAVQSTATTERDTLVRRSLQAARCALGAGQVAEVNAIVDEVLPTLTGPPRGLALKLKGEAGIWSGSLDESIAIFEEALPFLDREPAEAALVHLQLTFCHFQSMNDPAAVLFHADRAIAVAGASGAAGPVNEARAVRAMVGWLLGQGVDEAALDAATRDAPPDGPYPVQLDPHAIRATIVGHCGHIDHAINWFVHAAEQRRMLGRQMDLPYLDLHLATLACRAGRRPELSDATTEIAALSSELGGPFTRACGAMLQLVLAAYDGRYDEARRRGQEAFVEAAEPGGAQTIPWIAQALGEMELALGDPQAALQWLEPGLQQLPPNHMGEPAVHFFLTDAIEALIGVGELDRAQPLLDTYEASSERLGRSWTSAVSRRSRALLVAAQGDLDEAAAQATAAVELLQAEETVIHLGRAFLVLGQIERRRRRRAAAREAFSAARAVLDGAGAVLWRSRAEQELGRSWTPRSATDLTPTEERTARLAAAGRTNPEIARELVVSRRTVESTLSRVYRKLGVRSRTELARRLHDEPDTGRD